MIGFYILIFCIIAGPGMYLSGNLITPTDILLPVMFLFNINRKLKVHKIQKYIGLYIIAIILSLMVGVIFNNGIGFSSWLKAIRFSYVLMIPIIVVRYLDVDDYKEDKILLCILLSGLISGLIAIVLFLTNSDMYEAPEMFIFFGRYIHRAGGVFAEANYFGVMMTIIIISAVECITRKKYLVISIFVVLICGSGLIFSDSRSALLSLILALIFRFANLKKNKNIKFLFGILVVSVICYFYIPIFNSFINNRILSMFTDYRNGVNVNSISSGRINNWRSILLNNKNNNVIEILFGTGYKSQNLNAIVDNSYLSTMVTLGIFGFYSFARLWFYLLRFVSKFSKKYVLPCILKSIVVVFIITMIFLDTMTMVRCIYLLVLIYMFCLLKIKKQDY